MRRFTKYLGIALLPLLASCQSAGIWLANVPSNLNPAMERKSNLQYGDAEWQRLDVYYPATLKADEPNEKTTVAKSDYRRYPVVVFWHGGGWTTGHKEQYRFVADRLTREGFVVVIPDYVKYPNAIYPAYVKEAALVSRWLRGNIAQYKGKPDEMHLLGHSAGAHIAAMLLVDDRFLGKHNLRPDMYKSFVGLAGPYHFTPKLEKYKKIFGGGPNFSQMQAGNFANGDEPPMLLLHGEKDIIVSSENMRTLTKNIRDGGGRVENKLYPQYDHLSIIGAFSRAYSPLTGADVAQDTARWLKRH